MFRITGVKMNINMLIGSNASEGEGECEDDGLRRGKSGAARAHSKTLSRQRVSRCLIGGCIIGHVHTGQGTELTLQSRQDGIARPGEQYVRWEAARDARKVRRIQIAATPAARGGLRNGIGIKQLRKEGKEKRR